MGAEMRVLVTGARGMLGRAVTDEYSSRGWEVVPLGHGELDITDLPAVRCCLREQRPAVVVNCAAYTQVDRAESEEDKAVAVNALGVRNLALACKENDVTILHISTDYVFPGDKDKPWHIYDGRSPINAYGRSKYMGERFLETVAPKYYLVRTSWLFGPGGVNFIDTILRLAREQEELRVVDDQFGCPTYTRDLARALADLVASGTYGVYHITNQEATAWYELARTVLKEARINLRLKPVKSTEFPRPAKRPANSILGSFPLRETIGYLLPPWENALHRYIAELPK
jgi:dTDP-4-dehydrorhamnose reductase